jgi:hypothetical protein
MSQRHQLGHMELGRDRPHASRHQERTGKRLGAVTLDDSGDDKDESPRTEPDDQNGRFGQKNSRWAVEMDAQAEYHLGRDCSPPWARARSIHQH